MSGQDIASAFERQVSLHPERPAVGSLEGYLNYRDLNLAANRLAHLLISQDHCPGAPVAILMAGDSSSDAIVALIATLKAGYAMLPLDRSAPPGRLHAILTQAPPSILLTDQASLQTATEIAPSDCPVIIAGEVSSSLPDTNPEVLVEPGAVSGIFFTSGSTGTPRGVLQTHRNLLHNIGNYARSLQVTQDDRFSLLSPLHVVASCSAIFGALLNGASVFPFDVRRHGFTAMRGWLKRKKITVLHCVPTLFRRFCHSLDDGFRLQNIRAVKLGGEPAVKDDAVLAASCFSEGCLLLNGLGMTEANGNVTHLHLSSPRTWTGAAIPIGYPLDGFKLTLEDAAGNPVGRGEVGEIIIESEFLSPGYWNDPGLTAERFRTTSPSTRQFRSGDLGRFLSDGALEHLGRRDDQVKIRGNRVSLPEVEATLREYPPIAEACVISRGNQQHGPQLVAFLVPRDPSDSLDLTALHQFLRERLPANAVPSRLVAIGALPLTPNGKTDRRALAANPEIHIPENIAAATPEDEHQSLMASIWQPLLPAQALSPLTDFFQAGGDSLSALVMLARVESTFDVAVPLSDLARAPTMGQLLALVESASKHRGASDPSPILVTLRQHRSGRPVFVIPGAGSDVSRLLPLAARWKTPRTLCAFQWLGINGRERPHSSIEAMAAHFLKAMRDAQPSGPYHLVGTSFGGLVAFEMACQLQGCGDEITHLTIVDTRLPGWLMPNGHSIAKSIMRKLYRLSPVGGVRGATWKSAKAGSAQRKRLQDARRSADSCLRAGNPVPHTERYFSLLGAALEASRNYHMTPYRGDVALLRTAPDAPTDLFHADPFLGWKPFIHGSISITEIPGNHAQYLLEPHVAKLAEALGNLESIIHQ